MRNVLTTPRFSWVVIVTQLTNTLHLNNGAWALEILIRVNQSGERYAFRSLTGNFVEEETSENANRRAVSPHL